jgi:hypothetical protein
MYSRFASAPIFKAPGIRLMTSALLTITLLGGCQLLQGQISVINLTGAFANPIPTSVPFLTIAPDARAAGMGDAGAASTADVNSQHWNAAKYPFVEGKGGVAFTYTPWLSNLVPGIFHLYLSGFYRIDLKSVISSSIRYFSLGTIYFRPPGASATNSFYPYEFAVDAGYSRKLSERFSGGIVFRYIRSELIDGLSSAGGTITGPGTSVAGDLGLYYQDDIQAGGMDAKWAVGLLISNIGTPISYSKDAEPTPIPTNLRLGGRFTLEINESHSLSFVTDLNKLLVPTPPVYNTDTATNEMIIIRGKEAPESVIMGMLQSFYDAPGMQQPDGTYSVASEELHEIYFSLGAEYKYKNRFAFRSGYCHEYAAKGNRKYATLGIGATLGPITFDLSYLLPTNGQSSPLQHTYRLALSSTF